MKYCYRLIFSLMLFCGLNLFAQTTAPQTRHRGFMVLDLEAKTLEDLARDWNANLVRYQLPIRHVAATHKITLEQAWAKMMADLPAGLDRAKKLGIIVVIDLHGLPQPPPYPGNATAAERKQKLQAWWDDETTLRKIIASWEQMATICKDRQEEIWFDLYNEPLNWNDMPSYAKKWPEWAQKIIDAIRKIDTRHTVVVEPGPGGLCWGFKDFPALKDHNIIYSAHHYQPHAYTMQGIRDITGTDLAQAYLKTKRPWPGKFDEDGKGGFWDKKRLEEEELKPVIEFQKKHNVRIFIGEFSVARWAPNGAEYLRDCIEIFEKYGWDWSYHAFRESRIWSLEHENEFSPTPRLATAPTDRAAMVLQYLKLNQNVKKQKE